MKSSTILLTNALVNTNQLLTVLLADPAIPPCQKELIKERLSLNSTAISIAKIQEDSYE